MFIEDKRHNDMILDELDNGEVFEVKRDGKQSFFIKTDETYNSGDIKCVNIETGEIREFLINTKVEFLVTKLVIE